MAMPNGVYTNNGTRMNQQEVIQHDLILIRKSLIIYLILVNTHISRTNPSSTEVVETLRLLQVARIQKLLVEFARNQDAPILFCGDLNSTYNSLAYELITCGTLNNRKLGNAQWSIHKQGIYCTFRLRNSYEPTSGIAPGPYTDRKIIDYISYSGNLAMPNGVYTNKESIAHSVCGTRMNQQEVMHQGLILIRKSLIIYLILVNTHISQTNPSKTEVVETLRLLQVARIRKHLVEFARNQDAPILFCGDLNSSYNSLAYELITSGTLNNRKLGNAQWSIHKQGIYCTFRLRNSYEPTRGNAPGPYTDRKIIDYISYSGEFEVNTHLSRTNPSNTEAVETLRLLQVATIRKHLVEFARNQDAPILFCGDLNSSYNSLAYELITSALLNNRKLGNAQWSIHKQGIYAHFLWLPKLKHLVEFARKPRCTYFILFYGILTRPIIGNLAMPNGVYTNKEFIAHSFENHFEVIDFLCLPNLHGKNAPDLKIFLEAGSDHMPMMSRFIFWPLRQNGIA
ncbi:hypothetical protein H6P81_002806 [Aristolochia fimbriata]|uniref:Endonuclease/exonuclease/phosphatase domain-containing protein n=1 Tax=Aristolochia fimbriata TaxID=158543 RepID=A0AAV7FFC3_ARIFI|nr:hypothetical protein H6P81_002806 [Aristolochia fimbriata]